MPEPLIHRLDAGFRQAPGTLRAIDSPNDQSRFFENFQVLEIAGGGHFEWLRQFVDGCLS